MTCKLILRRKQSAGGWESAKATNLPSVVAVNGHVAAVAAKLSLLEFWLKSYRYIIFKESQSLFVWFCHFFVWEDNHGSVAWLSTS